MRNFHLADEIRNRRHKSKNGFAALHLSAGVEEDDDASLPPTRPPQCPAHSSRLIRRLVAGLPRLTSSATPAFCHSAFLFSFPLFSPPHVTSEWQQRPPPAPLFLGPLPCRGGQTEGAKGPRREGHSSNSKYVSTLRPPLCG